MMASSGFGEDDAGLGAAPATTTIPDPAKDPLRFMQASAALLDRPGMVRRPPSLGPGRGGVAGGAFGGGAATSNPWGEAGEEAAGPDVADTRQPFGTSSFAAMTSSTMSPYRGCRRCAPGPCAAKAADWEVAEARSPTRYHCPPAPRTHAP